MKTKHLLIIGFILFIAAAICTDGYFHPDEHFQLLEFANYKMGEIPGEHLPWEFDEKMRPTFQVAIVYGLCVALKSMGMFDPFVASMLLRFLSALLSFYVLYLFYNRYKSQIQSQKSIWWFAALTFLLWYVPYISVRYSSEAFGTIFMLAALLMYDVPHHKKQNFWSFLLIGIFLGLSFISRFQMGFMIGGFGLWILFIRKEKFVHLMYILLGFLVSFGIGQLCDYWFYGEMVSSPYHYFYQNLVVNKAAEFGVSPFWYYAAQTPIVFPLLGIIIVPCLIAFFVKQPKHIFTWLLIPFILVHHLIGHKELRFLFPISPFLPFIIIFIIEKIQWMRYLRFFKYVFWIINIPALVIMTFKPAFDNMQMFRYLYHHQGKQEVYYLRSYPPFMMYQYEMEKRPFIKGKDLRMTFFYRPDFNPHPVDHIPAMIETVKQSGEPVLFVTRTLQYEEIYKPRFDTEKLNQKIVYTTYHSWLKPINVGNWISRDDVGSWSVVEINR